MDWSHVLSVLAGVVGTRAYFLVRERLSSGAKWKCPEPGCRLNFETNNKKFMDIIKMDHYKKFHPNKKVGT